MLVNTKAILFTSLLQDKSAGYSLIMRVHNTEVGHMYNIPFKSSNKKFLYHLRIRAWVRCFLYSVAVVFKIGKDSLKRWLSD